ncbi:NAD-dependent succinate-semialdehyde dehydrogenase [Nitrosococcus wardiae]|uniref:NAD-dependent succinate-semialdehyde dehydrogenase n=1 Tax=Nitrosococcus wardiae TaxID=1814290 RepID=A0A4V1AVR4_9GAMM|nr:NAD-dependent succinate-semialdehyde dehydrogenase [Nitrosococcus wardiae]QBQ54045.1 NAD-dependent succinate-semialdehyde dehydrogenase [Nitrosococcus wardiae]
MAFESVNPATGQSLKTFSAWDKGTIEEALQQVQESRFVWATRPLSERCRLLGVVARQLRERKEDLARVITLEMGKLVTEARAEIEKCAWVCEYYAEQAPRFLADEVVESDAGRSYVALQPLGTVLAIMPWNFPFWQVFRFCAPALVAGNTALLKHASNVPQCALAIEQTLLEAGFPHGVFRTLLVTSAQAAEVIADPRVQGVTLTGSEAAGRKVAECAGQHLKKTVLELGGADPFIVLADADLEQTVPVAVQSRFVNGGQSCIAAKRFIVMEKVADEFVARFQTSLEALRPGDPLDEQTTLAPLARLDLREELHRQVKASIEQGAVAVTGCHPLAGPGAYYAPSILDRVQPGMPAFEEELFGPVAAIIRVADEVEAVALANASRYGLGGSVWSRDVPRAEALALQLQCGAAFVNGLVKSDPRLPFGGVKCSGYGRELSWHGMREFVNQKTVWIK